MPAPALERETPAPEYDPGASANLVSSYETRAVDCTESLSSTDEMDSVHEYCKTEAASLRGHE